MAKSPDAFRTISEVSEWLDTKPHVLRFWESKFKDIAPVKRAGGRRYYRPEDMRLIGGIKKLLHDDGMTIKGVQKMLAAQGVEDVAALSPPLDFEAAATDHIKAAVSGDDSLDNTAPAADKTDTIRPDVDSIAADTPATDDPGHDALGADSVGKDAAASLAAETPMQDEDAVSGAPASGEDVGGAVAQAEGDALTANIDGPVGEQSAADADAAASTTQADDTEDTAPPTEPSPDDAASDHDATIVHLDGPSQDDDSTEEPLLFPEIGDEEFWEDAAAADSEDKVIHLTPRVRMIDTPKAPENMDDTVFAPLPAQRPTAPVATLYTLSPKDRAALAATRQKPIVDLIVWAQRRVSGS